MSTDSLSAVTGNFWYTPKQPIILSGIGGSNGEIRPPHTEKQQSILARLRDMWFQYQRLASIEYVFEREI